MIAQQNKSIYNKPGTASIILNGKKTENISSNVNNEDKGIDLSNLI